MTQIITAPSPGESITEVILNWVQKDGDFVKKNAVIAEFESEKASLEVVAEQDGILKISVEDGKECSVGQEVGEVIDKIDGGKTIFHQLFLVFCMLLNKTSSCHTTFFSSQ